MFNIRGGSLTPESLGSLVVRRTCLNPSLNARNVHAQEWEYFLGNLVVEPLGDKDGKKTRGANLPGWIEAER